MEHEAPWLILAGSGGIADVLAALMSQPHLLGPQVAEKQFKEKFPSEHFSWEDIVHWTELVGTPPHTPESREQSGRRPLLPALYPIPGQGWPWGSQCPLPTRTAQPLLL